MPAVSDFIATNIITELNGVSMNSLLYWKIDDLGDDDDVVTNITKIANAYVTVLTGLTVTDWAVTCITYFNQTQTEPKIVFPLTIPGSEVSDSHPQSSVIRLNRWGVHVPDGRVRDGAHFVSGIPEELSSRGRFNDIAEWIPMENFFSGPVILNDDGWTLSPALKITPDWKLFPLVKAFILTTQCQVNPTFTVLRSRKTALCGTA